MKRIGHWIDGRVVPGASGRQGPVYNPAIGSQTGLVDLASADEVDTAIASAVAAFPDWRGTSLARRAEVLFAFHQLVDGNRKEIAALITAEHGRVLADAAGEVARGSEDTPTASNDRTTRAPGAVGLARAGAAVAPRSASHSVAATVAGSTAFDLGVYRIPLPPPGVFAVSRTVPPVRDTALTCGSAFLSRHGWSRSRSRCSQRCSHVRISGAPQPSGPTDCHRVSA
jgi:Aldehyde dehydrogenase family